MDFLINTEKYEEGRIKYELSGRLNALSTSKLKDEIKLNLSQDYKKIIVDLSSLTFMDSSGMAAMVSGLKGAREIGGYFRLFGVQKQVLSVLRLTKLDRVFEIYSDEESAWKG